MEQAIAQTRCSCLSWWKKPRRGTVLDRSLRSKLSALDPLRWHHRWTDFRTRNEVSDSTACPLSALLSTKGLSCSKDVECETSTRRRQWSSDWFKEESRWVFRFFFGWISRYVVALLDLLSLGKQLIPVGPIPSYGIPFSKVNTYVQLVFFGSEVFCLKISEFWILLSIVVVKSYESKMWKEEKMRSI